MLFQEKSQVRKSSCVLILIQIFLRIAPRKNSEKDGLLHLTRKEIDYANALLIDRIARGFFPMAWVIFELIYWFSLVEIHKNIQDIIQ